MAGEAPVCRAVLLALAALAVWPSLAPGAAAMGLYRSARARAAALARARAEPPAAVLYPPAADTAPPLDQLRRALRGDLIVAGNATYNARQARRPRACEPSVSTCRARPPSLPRRSSGQWNTRFVAHPLAIAYVDGPDDVQTCLAWAVNNSVQASLRSGGHQVEGWAVCDGCLAIDISRLNHVDVNTAAMTVDVRAASRASALGH